jgi:hypothetical protein
MVEAFAEVGPLRNKVSDMTTQLALKDVEIERLRAEVAWLRKADRLVCWNPATAEWEVRLEVREANGAVKCCRADKPIP